MFKGMAAYLASWRHLSGKEDFSKSLSLMLSQWGYRDFPKVLAVRPAQVSDGRRTNFEGLAFANRAILRQKDH